MATRRQLAFQIGHELVATLDPDERHALARTEDLVATIQTWHRGVRISPLKADSTWANDNCSCDGFYDATFEPVIFYLDTVHPRRARFTLLHELAHHLLQHEAQHLLDELDAAAGNGDPQDLEESTCHSFAGRILIPDEILQPVVVEPVVPAQLEQLVARTSASREAAAVRLAECIPNAGAVVIIREPDHVSFCATSLHGDLPWWPRNARVQPSGPLSRALDIDHQRARDEEYRWQLSDAVVLYCDTHRVRPDLAIAVLSEQPSRSVAFAPPGSRIAGESDETDRWCVACGGFLGGPWCPRCHARRCRDCERCECDQPRPQAMCPSCFTTKPHRAGARVCFDCEADGIT